MAMAMPERGRELRERAGTRKEAQKRSKGPKSAAPSATCLPGAISADP